jgi:hypothetical protein
MIHINKGLSIKHIPWSFIIHPNATNVSFHLKQTWHSDLW